MMKFLQFALINHNNITDSMNWFSPAAFSPGSHSFIGYPWEIFRTSSILPDNTRAITINRKGGGLLGYYSYSVVIPSYDLAVFMVVGGELVALNGIFDAVMNPLVQGAERVAQNGLANMYAGNFTAKSVLNASAHNSNLNEAQNTNLDSSITIAQSDSQSLFIQSWTSNSTSALDVYKSMAADQGGFPLNDIYFQFIPTFETRARQDGAAGEVWRFINVLKADGQPLNSSTVWSDYCVGLIDPLTYAGVSAIEAIFWKTGATTRFEEVELTALRVRLFRV
jgi:hypothetical protein